MIGFLTIGILACAMPVFAQPVGLDGRTFSGEYGRKGDPTVEGKDTLIFEDGRLRSRARDLYRFGEGDYTANFDYINDLTTFQAETLSRTDGRIAWKGNIKRGILEADFTWYRPNDQPPIDYWVRARAD